MPTPRFNAKIETEVSALRLAVLIDADNAQATIVENLLSEIAVLGEATVKRIYGDFTTPQSISWKKVLQKFAIKPVQQFAYTSGKNATDSSLIIDAMDLLYTGTFDGFCLVSSDSDFTGLAIRLRESGLKVYGFGEQKTPEAFRSACHKFTFTEILRPEKNKTVTSLEHNQHTSDPLPDKDSSNNKADPATQHTVDAVADKDVLDKKDLQSFLMQPFEQATGENDWLALSALGSYFNKIRPDFDPRTYGYKKLSDLMRSRGNLFEIEERPTNDSDHKVIYIRLRKK